jgi:hypothetical protein
VREIRRLTLLYQVGPGESILSVTTNIFTNSGTASFQVSKEPDQGNIMDNINLIIQVIINIHQ